ncbi:hypothetical protein ACQ4PT_028763 [Festuca glaucescens]
MWRDVAPAPGDVSTARVRSTWRGNAPCRSRPSPVPWPLARHRRHLGLLPRLLRRPRLPLCHLGQRRRRPLLWSLPRGRLSAAPYRLPTHLRLGARGPAADARPSIKDRLGGAGAETRSPVDAGGSVPRPERARDSEVEVETPYMRGLRREHTIRDAPAGRTAEELGEPSYARVLRQEQELREAALAAVVGGQRVSGGGLTVGVAAEISAARPTRERCIIYRTHEVDEAERALKWGLVAFVSGTRHAVRCSVALAAVLERFPAVDGHVSVHIFWLADLLFVFDSRAKRDILLAADPFDGRDFSLRFDMWNQQLQATRRTMRYRVHLEVVGVPAVAWNLATARMILGSSAWVERLGTETASREDLGSFRITAWTDDPASIPKIKEIWVAEPLIFGEEDDDLLLPVEALIPEEVALLGHEATVHLVRVEDPVGVAGGPSPGDDRGDDRGGGGFGRPRDDGGARPPRKDPPGPDRDARPPGRLAQAPPRWWRGGSERTVAVGFSTTVRPWPRRDGSDVGELGQQQQVEGASATLGAEQSLVRWPVGGAGRSPSPV